MMYNTNYYQQQQPYGGGFVQPQPYGQFNYGAASGYYNPVYGQSPHKQPEFKNILTPEMAKLLSGLQERFSLTLTDVELAKSYCCHCDPNTGLLIKEQPDGTYYCPLCKESFVSRKAITDDALENAAALVTDALQWIKLQNAASGTISEEAMREFAPIIALIAKVPQLFNISSKEFSGLTNNSNWGVMPGNANAQNAFSLLNGIAAYNPMMMQPYPQPAYMNPQQTPFGGYQQPPAQQPYYGGGYAMPQQQPMYQPQPQPQSNQFIRPNTSALWTPEAHQVAGNQTQQQPLAQNPLDVSSAQQPMPVQPPIAQSTQQTQAQQPVAIEQTKSFNI